MGVPTPLRKACRVSHHQTLHSFFGTDRNGERFKAVQTAYSNLRASDGLDLALRPTLQRNLVQRFDTIFDEMERRVRALNIADRDGGTYYSKQTYVCSRNGKTVTKIEENVNGDIKQFESYDHRPT